MVPSPCLILFFVSLPVSVSLKLFSTSDMTPLGSGRRVTLSLWFNDSEPGRLIGRAYIIGHFTYILSALLLSHIVERQHLSV